MSLPINAGRDYAPDKRPRLTQVSRFSGYQSSCNQIILNLIDIKQFPTKVESTFCQFISNIISPQICLPQRKL
jgi:hypothetical protein